MIVDDIYRYISAVYKNMMIIFSCIICEQNTCRIGTKFIPVPSTCIWEKRASFESHGNLTNSSSSFSDLLYFLVRILCIHWHTPDAHVHFMESGK